jgi:transposase
MLAQRLGLNSRNSSKPPSADPNREKRPKSQSAQKPGGQKGHKGNNLRPVETPDIIHEIPLDRSTLPEGQYRDGGIEKRQVFDIDISAVVTEYQAQVLINEQGKRFVAPFPEGVTRPAQYGPGIKANSVYMSMFQLIPYNRVEDHFLEQMGIPISAGSIFNFNQEAHELLGSFDQWVCNKLISSDLIHADETGINIGGKRVWLHNASNSWYTFFYPHHKRGHEAMDAMGVLPFFQGTLCHDHWKPYFHYGKDHALCNAHHLRELEWAWEKDKQLWASKLIDLLKEMNKATEDAGGCLDPPEAENLRQRYRKLIQDAEEECPPPDLEKRKGKRGRIPRSKSRNLLERLRDHESEVLRFMTDKRVPFSNNLAESDVRMTKVQQKISGCFRSWQGAEMFCRIRSYISTCRKHNVSATVAMRLLFEGKLPEFVDID